MEGPPAYSVTFAKGLKEIKEKRSFFKISLPSVCKEIPWGWFLFLRVSVYQSKHTVNETQRDAKGSFFELINGLFKELRAWLASLSKASFDTGSLFQKILPEGMVPSHKINPPKPYQVFFFFFWWMYLELSYLSKCWWGGNGPCFLLWANCVQSIGFIFPLPWCTLSRPI